MAKYYTTLKPPIFHQFGKKQALKLNQFDSSTAEFLPKLGKRELGRATKRVSSQFYSTYGIPIGFATTLPESSGGAFHTLMGFITKPGWPHHLHRQIHQRCRSRRDRFIAEEQFHLVHDQMAVSAITGKNRWLCEGAMCSGWLTWKCHLVINFQPHHPPYAVFSLDRGLWNRIAQAGLPTTWQIETFWKPASFVLHFQNFAEPIFLGVE